MSTALAQETAEEEQGFFSKIISSIKSFFSRLFGSSEEPAGDGVVCEKPYIRVGIDCCLDANDNSICDSDEETTTSSVVTTSVSTTVSSTSTVTTSTTAPTTSIACNLNSDCGNVTVRRICNFGDVYEQTLSPVCRNPGKPNAQCTIRSSKLEYPLHECTGYCKDGECTWT
ncbi:MAG: hypothetical protein V1921_01680 [Candidatus Altiarchaeota archaeon]